MRWLRLRLDDGRPAWGRVEAEAGEPTPAGAVHLHAHGDIEALLEGELPALGQTLALADLLASDRLLPPCEPRQIVGLWNNFRAAAAKNGWAEPAEPLWFLKSPASLTGHGQAIPAPRGYDGRVAYEGELALVIGRRTEGVSEAEAAACIAGVTCANDVTAMELLNRDPSFAQWSRAKSFTGFCAVGPWFDTALDVSSASLRTTVAGRERQNFPLADMFFSPARIVALVSQNLTLLPGDLILCGTSLGVLPMKPGSEVAIAIDGLGQLVNTFAPPPTA
ncbi:MAG: hypothetical protein RL722_1578 [Pseudomonadota bacterium]|jgi:2-keto-4-pentenoate hydratase/2-oxohepta-3-ene-1,7-dioic acid hydratase in catechol pathway